MSRIYNALIELLFVPIGFFLPMLWKEFRSIKCIALAGIVATFLLKYLNFLLEEQLI